MAMKTDCFTNYMVAIYVYICMSMYIMAQSSHSNCVVYVCNVMSCDAMRCDAMRRNAMECIYRCIHGGRSDSITTLQNG